MKCVLLALILGIHGVAFAEQTAPAPEHKAALCAACHGANGISNNPAWPHLAGQHAKYLSKQLRDMQQGQNIEAPTMKSIVASLTEKDIEDLSQYYAKMPQAQGSTPQQLLKRGEQLYRGGDFSKHITACIACHGPKGTGNAQAGFPLLSGQQAAYTLKQLMAFKEGKRRNDLQHIMQGISANMSQDDMEAVSHYLEGLH